jgi:hypothetical protein
MHVERLGARAAPWPATANTTAPAASGAPPKTSSFFHRGQGLAMTGAVSDFESSTLGRSTFVTYRST